MVTEEFLERFRGAMEDLERINSRLVTAKVNAILPHFTCPKCGMTSYNAHDIDEGYCGNCHTWTGLGY